MINVSFLGFGNVGYHLCNSLIKESGITIIQIYNRSSITLPTKFAPISFTTKLSEIKDADIYIIAVPDDAIESFSESLPFKNKLVVHTSGGADINKLSKHNKRGVLYPLQTFTKNKTVAFKDIPICIEAENDSDLALIRKLGERISEKVVEIKSEDRARLHLAAVFVNNFVNYIYQVSEAIVTKEGLDFDLLKPLILETAHKIEVLSPKEVQTGPAKRNDLKTIEKHLHLLDNSPHKVLYQQITKAIQDTYGKKL